ncbi:MAG: PEGA domain-containing protein [Acidobacteriota bacterium]|jgi:hypothetical protein
MKGLKVGLVMLSVLLLTALPVSAAGRFHGGFRGGFHEGFHRGIIIRPIFGPGFWNNPFFYGPYGWYGPYGSYGFYWAYPGQHSNAGKLKLKTNVKSADVYINGAFAGKAEDLKSIWLRPGEYDLQISADGYQTLTQKIYVIRGKTLKVNADLNPSPTQ